MASSTVISYPIPAYQNLPINANFYQPSQFLILNIDLGINTVITTTTDMNYSIGQEIRLIIPSAFGSYQLNGQTGIVIDIPVSNQVVTTIDSSKNVDEFIFVSSPVSPIAPYIPAQILAIGDINNGATNNQGRLNNATSPPGAFINISPE
jgi:hypothetical protein